MNKQLKKRVPHTIKLIESSQTIFKRSKPNNLNIFAVLLDKFVNLIKTNTLRSFFKDFKTRDLLQETEQNMKLLTKAIAKQKIGNELSKNQSEYLKMIFNVKLTLSKVIQDTEGYQSCAHLTLGTPSDFATGANQ
jgi:hypothetical protein